MNMDQGEKEDLEAAGFRFGDFGDFLGMDEAERNLVAFRADLGAAIRRLRTARGQTQARFAKAIGSSQPKVARMEIGAPEVSLDLMLRAYFAAGGQPTIELVAEPVASPEVARASRDESKLGEGPTGVVSASTRSQVSPRKN
jgi:transcriptional regulator with XRE-family HTH domain